MTSANGHPTCRKKATNIGFPVDLEMSSSSGALEPIFGKEETGTFVAGKRLYQSVFTISCLSGYGPVQIIHRGVARENRAKLDMRNGCYIVPRKRVKS